MKNDTVYKLHHSAGVCFYHFVFVCKYRRKYISGTLARDLRMFFHRACKEWNKYLVIDTIEIGNDEGDNSGDYNHLHILLKATHTLSPSDIAKRLKARTTYWIRKYYPAFKDKDFWKVGYFVSTVSLGNNLEATRKYIQEQQNKN